MHISLNCHLEFVPDLVIQATGMLDFEDGWFPKSGKLCHEGKIIYGKVHRGDKPF